MASIHLLDFRKALALGFALLGLVGAALAQAGLRYYPLSEKDYYVDFGNKRFYLVQDPTWRVEPESKKAQLKEELKARNLPLDESALVAMLKRSPATATKARLDGEIIVDTSKEREISLSLSQAKVEVKLTKTGDNWQATDPDAVEALAQALKIKRDVLVIRLANGDGKLKEQALWNQLAARLLDQPNFVLVTGEGSIAWVHSGTAVTKPADPPLKKEEPKEPSKDTKTEPEGLPWIPIGMGAAGGLVIGALGATLLRPKKPKQKSLSPNMLKLTEFVEGQVEKRAHQGTDLGALEKAAVAEMLDRYANYAAMSSENQRLQQYKQFQDNFDRNVQIVEQHKLDQETAEATMRRIQAEKEQLEQQVSSIKSEQRRAENQLEQFRAESQATLEMLGQSDKLIARYEELMAQLADSMAEELGKTPNRR